MAAWHDFVKKVRAEKGISYKEALKAASPLWRAQKEGKAKKKVSFKEEEKKAEVQPAKKKRRRRKKKVVQPQPSEVEDFPKVKPSKTRKKVAKTEAVRLTNLGGSLLPLDKPTRKRKARKRKTIMYADDANSLAKKLRV